MKIGNWFAGAAMAVCGWVSAPPVIQAQEPVTGRLAHGVGRPVVAFVNPGFGDRGFWKDVRDTMQAASDQLGFDLVVFDSDRKWESMAENAARVFAMHPPPDYIIAVNEHQQGTRIILEAKDRGIPILLLLNDLTDEQKKRYGNPGQEFPTWYGALTPDNRRAGFEMARSLVDARNDLMAGQAGGNHSDADHGANTDTCLLSLAGDGITPASLDRMAGLDQAVAAFPGLREQARFVVNWSEDEAYRRTGEWIAQKGCLDAVWAANDNIASGAIHAIEDAGMVPGRDVMVAGLNWSAEGLDNVANGKMTMTHGGHFLAGGWIMVVLRDYVDGVRRPAGHSDLRFMMQGITRENIGFYRQALGGRDWSGIDFSAFSLKNAPADAQYHFGIEGLVQRHAN